MARELDDIDWYGLVSDSDGSAHFVNARCAIEDVMRDKSRILYLCPRHLSRLGTRGFIRLVSDLAYERAYNYDHLFDSDSNQLSFSFELGCVEFEIVFTPTPNQPGDVVVKSRLAYWNEDEISDKFKEWKCLTHRNVFNFFRDAESHWSGTRYNRFRNDFFFNFVNFKAFTRCSPEECYFFTCTQVRVSFFLYVSS